MPSTEQAPNASATVACVVGAIAIFAVLVAGPGAAASPTIVALVVAFAALGVVLTGANAPPRAVVIGLGAVLVLTACVRPPTQSHDVWSYAAYGRMVAHYHANPYVLAPSHFPLDQVVHRVDPLWHHTRALYGPLFLGIAAVVAGIGGTAALPLRLGFQLVAAAAVLAAALLIDRWSDGDPRALAIVLLNPIVMIGLVNDGHADALVGLAVLAAVLLVERRLAGTAGAVMALGALVKIIALLPAGAIGCWLLLRRDGRIAVARFGAVLGIILIAGLALGGGRTSLAPLSSASTRVSGNSVWAPADRRVTIEQEARGDVPREARQDAGQTISRLASLSVLALAGALTVIWSGETTPAVVAGGAALAYTLLGAYVLPWYAAGGLFALALRRRSVVTWVVLAQAAVLQLGEVPGRRFTRYLHKTPLLDPTWEVTLRQRVVPLVDVVLLGVLLVAAARGKRARRPAPDALVVPPPG